MHRMIGGRWDNLDSGGRTMTDTNTTDAWDRFQADVKTLAGELRRNYGDADDEKTAEIKSSVRQLGQAAETLFESLGTATQDPQVRASTKQACLLYTSDAAD